MAMGGVAETRCRDSQSVLISRHAISGAAGAFASWFEQHITGVETFRSAKSAQIFLDRFFQFFGLGGVFDVGVETELRIRKSREDGGGTTVLDAYGFNAKKDLVAQLLEPNLTVAARRERGDPVTAPGIPPGYLNPNQLVTEDCIRPGMPGVSNEKRMEAMG